MIKREDFLLLLLKFMAGDGSKVESRTRVMKIIFLVQEELKDVIKMMTNSESPYIFTRC